MQWSPLARQLRLVNELRVARGETKIADIASRVSANRTRLTQVFNGSIRPNVDDITRIVTALELNGSAANQLMGLVRDASQRGWWDEADRMGPRQRVAAALEAGAAEIRSYQSMTVHGLLQVASFAERRVGQAELFGTRAESATADKVLSGRLTRQTMALLPDGPKLTVVMEEHVFRRLGAPPDVMREQLQHLRDLIQNNDHVKIRALPVKARIRDYVSPPGSFDIFAYSDPNDPTVVTLEATATTEDPMWHSLAHPTQVDMFLGIHERITEAALSDEETLALINEEIGELQ